MKRLAYKTLLLSIILLLILLVLPLSALADGGKDGNEFTQTVNGYQVTLIFEKPAAVGENQIHIRVNDAQNMPVPNVEVAVSVVKNQSEHSREEAHTSAHGQMVDTPAETLPDEHAEMGMTALTAGHHNGVYAGEIVIETTGDCVIRVHLTVQGKLMEVDFPLNVAQSQNGSGILLGFFAANVAIITMAVILKPKPVSVTLSKKA